MLDNTHARLVSRSPGLSRLLFAAGYTFLLSRCLTEERLGVRPLEFRGGHLLSSPARAMTDLRLGFCGVSLGIYKEGKLVLQRACKASKGGAKALAGNLPINDIAASVTAGVLSLSRRSCAVHWSCIHLHIHAHRPSPSIAEQLPPALSKPCRNEVRALP